MCILTCTIQVGVCYLMLNQMLSGDKEMYFGTTGLNCARVVASLLMHLNLYPNIRDPLKMLSFTIFYSDRFFQKEIFFPVIILCARMLGHSCIQFLSIYSILTKETSIDVINSFFVGFIIIKVEIVMRMASRNLNIAQVPVEILFQKNRGINDDKEKIKVSFKEGYANGIGMTVLVYLNRAILYVYKCVYFYFTPFLVVFYIFIYDDIVVQNKNLLTSIGAPK